MSKKPVVLCVLVCMCAFLYAGGSGESETKKVDEPAGFKESVDINTKKTGKYNFYIEAKDKGGNTTIAGPHNIYIDPESDLPIVGITNPRQDMRIPGNLNIVGTCVDDDEVAYVELYFNDDPSTTVRAEGADFWSYYLDTTAMNDDVHSITAWGVDINGLKGRTKRIAWHLDRKKPVTEVTSHVLGSLVSGRITLQGTVTDGNGIDNLLYSIDGGSRFSPVEIKHDKKSRSTSFSLPVDTRVFADGPAVIWFKAKDLQGTTGLMSWLMYVDNTKPDVSLVYPPEGQAVNGIFTVSGYARDVVGLKSLSWTLGKETGEFELTVGNPWWVKTFDIRSEKTNSIDLVITAVDVSGNVTVDKRRIPVDQNADLPVVSLIDPTTDAVFFGSQIPFGGLVRDDDGVESIFWSLDGGEAIEVPSTGSFQFLVDNVPPGPHTIRVWAKDITGITGPAVEVKNVVVAGDTPSLLLVDVTSDEAGKKGIRENRAFTSGIEVHSESNAALSLRVNSGSALKTISWKFGELPAQSLEIKARDVTGGETLQSIPVPATVGYGKVPVRIEAVDIHGRTGVLEDILRITDLSKARGDPSVVFEDVRISADGEVRLDSRYPFTGYLLGATAAKARLSRASSIVSLTVEGNYLAVTGGSNAGTEADMVIEVETDRGFTYRSRPFTFVNPGSVPSLVLDASDPLVWTVASGLPLPDISVSGRIEANLPVDTVLWKAYGPSGSSPVREGSIAVSGNRFALNLPARDLPFGPLVLEFSAATDGQSGFSSIAVYREDPDNPPSVADPKIKLPPPAVSWVEAGDIYYFVTYGGSLDAFTVLANTVDVSTSNLPRSGTIRRSSLAVGANTIALTVIERLGSRENKWNFTAKPMKAPPPPSIRLASADGQPWKNGVELVIPRGGKKGAQLVAIVDTVSPITASLWTVGTASGLRGSVRRLPDGSNEISVELPADLPADRTAVSVEVQFRDVPALRASGEFVIVRPVDTITIDTKESFAWTAPDILEDGSILMDHEHPLSGYYNGRPVASVSFQSPVDGLAVSVDAGRIVLRAAKDGLYSGVSLVITDIDGWKFKTDAWRFLVDNEAPSLVLLDALDGKWVKDSVRLRLEGRDANKLLPLEVSLDLGKNWQVLPTSNEIVSLSGLDDGVIGMSVRATDIAGRQTVVSFGIHKDTLAPAAEVIVPVSEARVNGEIRMGIAITEAGRLVRAEYEAPDKRRVSLEPRLFLDLMIGTKEIPLVDGMKFHFEDASGNVFVLDNFPFIIDQEMDLPVVEVNLPEDNEVVTTDFVISGIIYDDDKSRRVWYSIDNGQEIAVEAENAYSIPVELLSLLDNEHTVTVTAEDVYGVRGKPVTRRFRVSLEEPKASVLKPRFDETVKGIVELSGVSSDKNGIERVRVSLDNGNSFNDATGTEQWSYRFDSKILKDGTHVVFVRVWDKYGIEGLYSSLINIDNTAPGVSLESPMDGLTTVGPVYISGQATDTISLRSVTLNLRSLEGKTVPADLASISLEPDSILSREINLSKLPDGLYNLDVWAIDEANNVTRVSRNLRLAKESVRNFIECLYPLDGEYVQGSFNLYGYVGGADKAGSVSLLLDGQSIATEAVTTAGYFRFSLDSSLIPDGAHKLSVRSDFDGKETVTSATRTVNYASNGPWVTVDSLTMGDFAFMRPWLTGRTGYVLSEEDKLILEDKKAEKELRDAIRAKRPQAVEISFDNGRTFREVEFDRTWRFRLETQDMTEGMHYLVVRSRMYSGETAVTRMLVQIDKTAPTIRLISPESGGRYNQEMEFTALVNDDIELGDVQYVLRQGDKAAYEVPGFIQGLYFDTHFWGGTLFDVGVGLTFFDDNVKLQVQYGQFTEAQWKMFSTEPMRYGGTVVGAKLLANIFYMPFSYLLGPDWTWLSGSLALGANYSYFTITQSGKPQMMSAVLTQLEFPRVTIEKMKMFRTFSFYTEFQLWFLPTDVDTSSVQVDTLMPHLTCGLRLNVF